jgi:hypothetical protein
MKTLRKYIIKYTGASNVAPYLMIAILLKLPLILYGGIILSVLGILLALAALGILIFTYKWWSIKEGQGWLQ